MIIIDRKKPELQFEQIIHGTIREQKKIAQRILYNMEQRSNLMSQPCDPKIGIPQLRRVIQGDSWRLIFLNVLVLGI